MPRPRRAAPDSESAACLHDKAVDCCVGRALRWAVADGLQMPEASIGALEQACGFLTDDGARASGVIRAWTKGKLPKPPTVALVERRTGGRVVLGPVLRDPLFELARSCPPDKVRIKAILQGLPRAIRLDDFFDDSAGPELNFPPSFRLYQRLRDQGSMDAFIALIALTRRGEDADDEADHFGPARAAYDLWPRAVASSWVRHTDWMRLTQCLHRVLWNRVYDGIPSGTTVSTLLQNIAAVTRDPHAQYQLLAGATRSEVDELLGETGALWLDVARLGDERGRVAVRQAARALEDAMGWLRRARDDERRRAAVARAADAKDRST